MQAAKILLLMATVVTALIVSKANADQITPQAVPAKDTATVMRSIFEPISAVLALSFNGEQFSSAENRPLITKNLVALRSNVSVLEDHAKAQSQTFQYVARSLARDVDALNARFSRGAFEEARFTLHSLVDNCIACHSSFKSDKKFPDAKAFMAKLDEASLSPIDRAYLKVVSRQFDDALSEYELAFSKKELGASVAVILGSFSDYLRIAIAVKNDLKRPLPILKELRERRGTLPHVRDQIDRWSNALVEFEKQKVFDDRSLDRPRKILTDGRNLSEFARDRDAIVHYVTAEALLTRYVTEHGAPSAQLAEAYYMLGIASDMLEHSIWIRRSEFYLETSIRMAPSAPFAQKAYAVLEERMIANFSGSSGTHVPADVEATLNELRELINSASQARKS